MAEPETHTAVARVLFGQDGKAAQWHSAALWWSLLMLLVDPFLNRFFNPELIFVQRFLYFLVEYLNFYLKADLTRYSLLQCHLFKDLA